MLWASQTLFDAAAPPGAGRVAGQLIWALLTGPLLLMIFNRLDMAWEAWRRDSLDLMDRG